MDQVKTFAMYIAAAATVSVLLVVALAVDAGVASAHAGSQWSAVKVVREHTVAHKHVRNGTLCFVDGHTFKLVSLNARNGDCIG